MCIRDSSQGIHDPLIERLCTRRPRGIRRASTGHPQGPHRASAGHPQGINKAFMARLRGSHEWPTRH
eukprot:11882737-Alexandrium_andersonii.AAC.1